MSTLHQLREGLSDAWEVLIDGWQYLSRRAAGAITRFSPGKQEENNPTGTSMATRSTGWGVLAAEVFDDDDTVTVRLEAPGMRKADFKVEVNGRYLVIHGEKQVEAEHTSGRYHVTECAYGAFKRAIPLPEDVKADEATASYRHGVLRIEMPKLESRHGGAVRIDVA